MKRWVKNTENRLECFLIPEKSGLLKSALGEFRYRQNPHPVRMDIASFFGCNFYLSSELVKAEYHNVEKMQYYDILWNMFSNTQKPCLLNVI